MALKKQATNVAAIPTEEGRAVIGGRPPTAEFYDTLNRQASGMPPAGATEVRQSPELPAGAVLPAIHVSRQALGSELIRLKAVEAAIERELARGPIGANGMVSDYLVQRQRDQQAALEDLREQIGRLSNLDDNQVRFWAAEHGRILTS